ncbi:MAG: TauD/TfdA dioxygenase family protein [Beijerinckiaceae bacterium]
MLDRTIGVPAATSPKAEPFAITPLAPGIGVEIHGIDCAGPVDESLFRQVLDAWHDNCVALFRNQDLNEQQESDFAARFGKLGKVMHRHNGASGVPGVMYISNIRENGELIGSLPDGEMFFHHDQCYIENPAIATMLYAMEVPSHGGNTLFANLFKAYDTLPDDIKQRLEGLKAMNVYDYDGHPTKRGAVIKEGTPHFAHPVVRTHPANGRKALYVNRLMTDHIVGMDPQDSDELLNYLFHHSERPEFVYEHVWRPGDLLIWDNRSSAHARTDFSDQERRLMRRVAILSAH